MRAPLVLLMVFAAAPVARASEMVVSLKDSSGQPVANAVVAYHPAAGTPKLRPAGPYVMSQEDIRFNPFILVAPVGAEVQFPNHDKVRHHVYSFSLVKHFEIKLYGRDETRAISFDHPGVVSLGCNIHDQMMGFVFVTDTPYTAKSGPRGEAVLEDLPPGPGVLTVWQPFLRSNKNEMDQAVSIPVQGETRVALTLNLRPPPADKAF